MFSQSSGDPCSSSRAGLGRAAQSDEMRPRATYLAADAVPCSPSFLPSQTTSIIGHLNKPSIQALIHGLNRHYYSIAISYRKSELEEKMLMNLNKKGWTHGLKTAGATAPICSVFFNRKLFQAHRKVAFGYGLCRV